MIPAPRTFIDGFQHKSGKDYGIFSKIFFYLVVLERFGVEQHEKWMYNEK
jgi:hypothetical protein